MSVFATDDSFVVRGRPRLRVLSAPPPGLEDVVAEHGTWLRRFVRRRMANPALVDDAVQETLLRLCRSSPPADPAQVRPWLATVAKRTCADVWRAHPTGVDSLDPVGERAPAGGAVVPGSDEHLVAVTERGRINRALRQLPPRHRRLLEKQAMLGLSYEEIADEEDISIACVTSALGRARAGFRRRYEDASAAWVALVYRVVDRLRSRAQAAFGGHAFEWAAGSVTLGMAAVLVVVPARSSSDEEAVPAGAPRAAATVAAASTDRGAPKPATDRPHPSAGRPGTAPAGVQAPPIGSAPAARPVGEVAVEPPGFDLTPQRWIVRYGVEVGTSGGTASASAEFELHCEGGRTAGALCPVVERVPGAESSR